MNKVLDKVTIKKTIRQLAILAGLMVLTILVGGCSVNVSVETAVPSPSVGAEPVSPTPIQPAPVSPTAIVVPPTSAALPSPTGVATARPSAILSPVVSEMSATPVLVPNTSTVVVAPTPTPTPNPASPTVVRPTATTSAPTLAATNPTSVIDQPTGQPTGQPDGQPDGEEQLFLSLLNQYRQTNGVAPLTFDPNLYKSARWMAQDMAASPTVSHTDSLGRNITTRIKAFGYSGGWTGENIAAGFEHAADNLKIWQSDDIHKNNLLGAHYTKVGVARYDSPTAHNHWSWVLDMG